MLLASRDCQKRPARLTGGPCTTGSTSPPPRTRGRCFERPWLLWGPEKGASLRARAGSGLAAYENKKSLVSKVSVGVHLSLVCWCWLPAIGRKAYQDTLLSPIGALATQVLVCGLEQGIRCEPIHSTIHGHRVHVSNSGPRARGVKRCWLPAIRSKHSSLPHVLICRLSLVGFWPPAIQHEHTMILLLFT